jgi:hypothetical protein
MLHTLHSLEQDSSRLSDLEADKCIAKLDGLFSKKALNIYADEPHPNTFPGKMRTSRFWQCSSEECARHRNPPIVDLYLANCLTPAHLYSFEEYMRVWADSFHISRFDRQTSRDLLIVFLFQNLSLLKQLYILNQPHSRDIAATSESLQECLEAPHNWVLFAGTGFSMWVLDNWLPFQLRYFWRHHDHGTEMVHGDAEESGMLS